MVATIRQLVWLVACLALIELNRIATVQANDDFANSIDIDNFDDVTKQSSDSKEKQEVDDGLYQIGVGIADVTGPAAEINMMGYAKLGQDTSGIHLRLRSRTFLLQDLNGTRILYINNDLAMVDQAITIKVLELLASEYGANVYNRSNVMISATHTHSGPGGFLQYLLYTLTAKGFVHQNFDLICQGILRSVKRAHANITTGRIYFNEGLLLNASINRSPSAYLNNPKKERDLYEHDTDKSISVLKFVNAKGDDLGMITWFAVHPTSMNNTNELISGDNKGWASLLVERHFNGKHVMPGQGQFVAAFSAANLGDVSPNINGPRCTNTGLPCDFDHSTCNGKNEYCIASGPGRDMFESTEIIATRQAEAALKLYANATLQVKGPIGFAHQYVHMADQAVQLDNGTTVNTCLPAMGYSFAAGTVDGPGAFNFEQGQTSSNPLWNFVRNLISKPTPELSACHAPKPILLATGQLRFPYDWQPHIVPTQVFRLGQVYIAGVPGEFTTMSGRRMKNVIRARASNPSNPKARLSNEEISAKFRNDLNNDSPIKVVLNGLTNAYSSYVATFEEYQIQRYEGASTIFGPYTLDAYLQQFSRLTASIVNQSPLEPGPEPPNLIGKQISLQPGVIFDLAGFGRHFGQTVRQPQATYKPGDQVKVTFVAGNPRNNPKQEESYLTIERKTNDAANWTVVADDGCPETRFHWRKVNPLGQSEADVIWQIPLDQESGVYRIRHSGSYKSFVQSLHSYEGQSANFQISN